MDKICCNTQNCGICYGFNPQPHFNFPKQNYNFHMHCFGFTSTLEQGRENFLKGATLVEPMII